jgi:hypothetical protein
LRSALISYIALISAFTRPSPADQGVAVAAEGEQGDADDEEDDVEEREDVRAQMVA